MRFDASQQMRLGQHMKLAPRMIQSMEILQMPLQQLEERIAQELESNATLELAEGDDGPEGAAAQAQADLRAEAAAESHAEEQPMRVDEGAGLLDVLAKNQYVPHLASGQGAPLAVKV